MFKVTKQLHWKNQVSPSDGQNSLSATLIKTKSTKSWGRSPVFKIKTVKHQLEKTEFDTGFNEATNCGFIIRTIITFSIISTSSHV